ncbi:nuclear body protein SP140-like protein [Erinaceus europaeus]|uniref:Nuclear body protein SP140-like protein n=1 Tax=Erinaceus europaeus TaxID=9365 RepID=A0ABM3XLP9_ERIEU|nr:nuclear body protein SP140-like protein [Erinaceus europaeus]
MFTGDQNLGEKMFKLFKEKKVNIASAITSPFPFFMGLQDQGFLPEQMCNDFLEACANKVATAEVAYRALSELEKVFNGTVLDVLFSKVNLNAYPDLLDIFKDFQKVILHSFHCHIRGPSHHGDSEEMPQIQQCCERGDTLRPVEFPESLADGEQTNIRRGDSSHGPSETRTQEIAHECIHFPDQTACGSSPLRSSNASGLEGMSILQPYNGEGEAHLSIIHVEPYFYTSTQRPSLPSPCLRDFQEDQTPQRTDRSVSEEMSSLLLNIEEVSWRFSTLQINDEDAEEIIRLLISDDRESGGEEHLQIDKEAESENLVNGPQPCDEQESGQQEPLSVDKEGESETLENSSPSCNGQESGEQESLQMDKEAESEESANGPRPYNEQESGGEEPLQTEIEGESEESANNPLVCHRQGTVNLGNSSAVERPQKKKRKKRGYNWSRSKRKRPRNTQNNGRLEPGWQARRSRQSNYNQASNKRKRQVHHKYLLRSRGSIESSYMDLDSPILPVTCGELNGTLLKNKFREGKECIQSEDGDWFTTREFEIKGGYERSKKWKMSIRCDEKTLLWLIKNGYLLNPPRMYYKRKRPPGSRCHQDAGQASLD